MPTTIVFADKDVLVLDATLSIEHGKEAEVTENPVEEGAAIADHVIVKPWSIQIAGLIAYHPLVNPGETPEENGHVKAWERLDRAIEKKELVTVQTGLHDYVNMAMSKLVARREPSTGRDIPLSLAFREVRFAKAQTAKVPKDAIGKADPGATPAAGKAQAKNTQAQATPRANKGVVPKTKPSAQQNTQPAKTKSWLKSIMG
jgi:hypothetical protein